MPRRKFGTIQTVGKCPHCGHYRYQSRSEAKRAARIVRPGQVIATFECGGYWHFGRLPNRVKSGLMARQDFHPLATESPSS